MDGAFYFSRKPVICSKPVFSLAEDGRGNLGPFAGSEDQEHRGLGCCFPPKNAEPGCAHPLLSGSSQQASSRRSSLPFILPALSSGPACVSACREGLPRALPTGCLPNPCHSTHKHIPTRSASLTREPHAHAGTFLPASSSLDSCEPMEPFWEDALDPAG